MASPNTPNTQRSEIGNSDGIFDAKSPVASKYNMIIHYMSKDIINVSVNVKNEEQINIEDIKNEINGLFDKKNIILMEFENFVFLRKINENFEEIPLTLKEAGIKNSLEKSIFNAEVLLNIQETSNISKWSLKKLLAFEDNLEKLFIYAIASKDYVCIRFLKLFEVDLNDEADSLVLKAAIQSRDFKTFLACLETSVAEDVEKETIEKFGKLQDVVFCAIKCRNHGVLQFLVDSYNKFPEFFDYLLSKEFMDLIVNKECFEIFNILKINKNANTEAFKQGDEVLREIDKLHYFISNNDLEGIKEFITKYPNHRLCYGNKKVSAIEHAIDCQKIKSYCYLRANFFSTENTAELNRKIENLSESERKEIRIENRKYTKNFPNAILLSKCTFDAASPVSSEQVRKMINKLSQINELKNLLEIASEIDIEIIFDFATEDVIKMDPTARKNTFGVFYFDGKIYVGRDQSKLDQYGTFVHELMHCVLQNIYKNNALPYSDGDKEREALWNEIVKNEKLKLDNETDYIIRWVFEDYEGDLQNVELAVRPFHIVARYSENPQRVDELKAKHFALFDYMDKYVLPDLRMLNVYRVIKFNNEQVIEKIDDSTLELTKIDTVELLNAKENLIITSNVIELLLLKIKHELFNIYENKLHASVQNLWIDVEECEKDGPYKEFCYLAENCDLDRLIFYVKNALMAKTLAEFLENFEAKCQMIILCHANCLSYLNNHPNYEFKLFSSIFTFNDLKDKSEIMNKHVTFQGRKYKVSKICPSISNEMFALLCSDDEIILNTPQVDVPENFIPRFISSESSESFDLLSFMQLMQRTQVVVISNTAGSGKTSLLNKIYEIFLNEYPMYWISFISLRNHFNELSAGDFTDFCEVIVKLLMLKPHEESFFKDKFSRGEVKILFDGFDEISPRCKDSTLAVFKLFQKQDKNQIWITTRSYLQTDLLNELNVNVYTIKQLTVDDQKIFLCNYWKRSFNDSAFVKNCADMMIEKISNLIKNYLGLVGTPLIIKIVAELFVDKINDSFPRELNNLKVYDIFKKIIEENMNILNTRFADKSKEDVMKDSSMIQAHEYLTLRHFFGEILANSLGTFRDPGWSLEDIARCGILNLDFDDGYSFNHETYPEFILADFTRKLILNFTSFTSAQTKLFEEVMTKDKFAVSKKFLEEAFEKFENNEFKFLNKYMSDDTLKCFKLLLELIFGQKNLPNFIDKLKKFAVQFPNDPRILNIIAETNSNFGLVVKEHKILTFFPHLRNSDALILLKGRNAEEFIVSTIYDENVGRDEKRSVILHKNSSEQNIVQILIQKNDTRVREILKMTVELFTISEIKEFLQSVVIFEIRLPHPTSNDVLIKDKHNLLHLAAKFLHDKTSHELIQHMIKLVFDGDSLKSFLTKKVHYKQNILHIAIKNQNEAAALSLHDFICREKLLKEFASDDDQEGENYFRYAIQFGSSSLFEGIFKKLKSEYSEEALKNYLLKRGGTSYTIMHSLAYGNPNVEAVDSIFNSLESYLGSDFSGMLESVDHYRYYPLHVAIMANTPDVFIYFAKLYERKFSRAKLLSILKKVNYRQCAITNVNNKHSNMDRVVEEYFPDANDSGSCVIS